MPDKVLKNIKPRKYQQEIYETCKEKNCLVVLPTGIGKTLCALMLCINRQKAVPGSKCLFLAPTRPLADQHLAYFKKHLPELFAQLTLFTGKVSAEKRKKLWERADIIFSTPQCISNDLKNNLYDLSDTSLLIEDECVTGNTKIKLSDGSLKKIKEIYKEFKLDSKIYVESLAESGNKEPQRILKVYKIKNKRKILKIKTKNRVIELTENHKVILKRGLKYLWTEVKNIKKEDEVAIEQNIENPKYKDKIIMSEEKMIEDYFLTYQSLDKYFLKIIHKLNERDILPLSYSNLKLKIISRLFGFILGDGWFTKIKGKPKILGFSGKIEDLEKIQRDLNILGVRYPKINSRRTNSLIRTDQNKIICVNGTTNSFNVTDSALAKLFEVLKMPQGSKTTNPFLIPEWLIKSPKFIKREFLSALMGCEGDIPKFKKDLRSPYATRYRFNKLESLKENALEYATQIQNLFNEFGIKSTIQIKSGNIRKDKQKTIKIQITLSNSNLNLHRFLEKIGYEYNYKKIKEANKVLNYLSYKEEELKKRNFFYRKIIQLKNRGFKIHKAIQIISKKFKIKPTRIWSLGYSNKANHASWLIDSYDKWSKSNKPNLNVKWEKIKDIKIEGNKKYVYDLTVEKNHNYIGNGFIVHNCHRCLKNYSYTYVAEKYKEQSKNPRILGLTASPGTDKQTITKIANNLGIESIELRTRESEDVKEYLQKLEFNVIKLEFPNEFKEIVDIIKKLYEKKVNELKNRKLIFRPANKITLLETQGRIMKAIFSGNRNFNYLSGASACAQAIKLSHLIELIQTQTLHTSIEYIKSIFQQASQNKSKAAKQIAKNPEFNQAYIKINELLAKNLEHPKLPELKSIVEESIKNNPKTKIIVFSQYRETGTRICKELNSIPDINAKVFVGQAKKTSDKGVVSGLNQKEQHEILNEFKEGKINLIVSTSIGEEGLDIMEVSEVIFYEPIPSAIRTIQRRGRTARLMKGNLTILVTKDTLDEIFYYVAIAKEKRMYKAISSIKEDLDNGKSIKDLNQDKDKKDKEEKQKKLF
jgi:ERCC4-related helicase/intein/homing endonuclease